MSRSFRAFSLNKGIEGGGIGNFWIHSDSFWGRRHCVKITAWCYFLFVLLKGMAKRQWQLVIAFWPNLSTAFSRIEWSKSWLTQEEARKAKNVVCRCVLCVVLIWCYTYVSICYLSLTSNAAATLSFSASRRTKFKSKSEKQQKQKVIF